MRKSKILSFVLSLVIVFTSFSVPILSIGEVVNAQGQSLVSATIDTSVNVDKDAIEQFVTRLYEITLDREPDADGSSHLRRVPCRVSPGLLR